jgi:hypothetical protein
VAAAVRAWPGRRGPDYRDDAVEIFINPNPQQEVVYYGFEMNARGVLYHDRTGLPAVG